MNESFDVDRRGAAVGTPRAAVFGASRRPEPGGQFAVQVGDGTVNVPVPSARKPNVVVVEAAGEPLYDRFAALAASSGSRSLA
ncbi:hypothetical protein [Streptomyces sp. YIM B13518]|uniref:hypothetical protein n=1 Tax=Streptomyces sp. YIM B13518 TaxID=3366316 RepID=UPI0036A8B152